MSFEIVFVLVLLVAAVVILATEWLAVDVVAVAMVVLLVLGGILTPADALRSFGSEFVFVLVSIFVLAGAITRTGLMDLAGRLLERAAGRGEAGAVGVIMTLAASLSAFLSNTNVTAVLMPAVLGYARNVELPASRLLMPLAFGTMLGGAATLLGTSTNLAANALLPQLGLEPFSLFEFLPVGVAVSLAGIAWMVLAGRYLLPRHGAEDLTQQYRIEQYLAELVVQPGSQIVGRALNEVKLREEGVTVLSLQRAGRRMLPVHEVGLHEGDVLMVKAAREALLQAEERWGLHPGPSRHLGDAELGSRGARLREAVVMPRSDLEGRSLRQLRFRQRFGVTVLAIYRRGHSYPVRVRELPLRVGDVLLLRGTADRLGMLQAGGDLWLLGEVDHEPFRRFKGGVALAALLGALVAGGSGLLPLSIALLLAVLVVVLAGVVRPNEVYEMVEWPLVVLIGGMASVGAALQSSGAADLLAGWVAGSVAPLGVLPLMAAFALLTMALTQPLSNAAAALVMLPVAVATASQVGLDPRSLAVLVTCAASLSFVTPFEPACLLVYAPGKYRFRDFVIAGLPLSLIALAVLLAVVPVWWPVRG